jgi:phage tail-like protein
MARSAASDPIRDFKFQVEIFPTGSLRDLMGVSGSLNLGFAAISGLTVTNEVVSYREGGMNTHPHKLVGQSDYGAVTFSRGVFYNQNQLYKWQQFMHTWSAGSLNGTGSLSNANDYRCTIGVKVLDHPASGSSYVTDPVTPQSNLNLPSMRLGYVLYNCWPGAFAMTDLNAASSGILVQQITVHHEGFQLVNTDDEYSLARKQ